MLFTKRLRTKQILRFVSSILVSITAAYLLVSCQGLRQIRNDIYTIVADQALEQAHLGIEVRSVVNGEYLFRHNAHQNFIPASNMKLYTTAAALLALTPDFRYETKLLTDGKITNGVLRGNLIIIGSGDPTISGHFNGGYITEVFDNWSKALSQMGVARMEGDILADNSYFAESGYGRGWQLDDLDHCYAAARDALSFNNNCIAVEVHAAHASGSPAVIRMEPETQYLKVTNAVVSSDPGQISITGTMTEGGILLTGHIPVGSAPYTLYVPVRKPAIFAASVFKEILSGNGIVINGDVGFYKKEAVGSSRLLPVAVHHSPPLSEIVKVTNRISNNLYAENLLLTVGKATSGYGTAKHAELAVQKIFAAAGLDLRGVRIADGSGLSRLNLITPHSTVELLYSMAHSAEARVFLESLATPGNEGTLQRFLTHTTAPVNFRAKTGSMTNVRNLSGYVTAASGELFAFSFLCNNSTYPVEKIDNLYGRILRYVADR